MTPSPGKRTPVQRSVCRAEANLVQAGNVHELLTQLEEFQPDAVYVWLVSGLGGLGLLACLHHLRIPWVWHLMDAVPLELCGLGGAVIPALVREFHAPGCAATSSRAAGT